MSDMSNENVEFSGSTKEVARNANRLSREKEIISERREDTLAKDMGVRPRSYYDDPDYEQIENLQNSTRNLSAPPLPGYEQRWISMNKDKGAHLMRMLQVGGWKLRDPKTIPNTAGLNTSKWGEYDAITAGNELVLCCMRKDFYEKRQRQKHEEQFKRTNDVSSLGRDLYGASSSVKSQHANIYKPEINYQTN